MNQHVPRQILASGKLFAANFARVHRLHLGMGQLVLAQCIAVAGEQATLAALVSPQLAPLGIAVNVLLNFHLHAVDFALVRETVFPREESQLAHAALVRPLCLVVQCQMFAGLSDRFDYDAGALVAGEWNLGKVFREMVGEGKLAVEGLLAKVAFMLGKLRRLARLGFLAHSRPY